MSQILQKYASEIGRHVRNGATEMSEAGLLIKPMKLAIGGSFMYSIDGGPRKIADNTATYEGLNDLLNVYFKQSAAPTAFYFVPYVNNVAPDATLTAANFNATMAEFTNYTEATRQLWTPGTVASQSVDNAAAPAQITIGTGGGTIRGAGLATASAKSATTGVLIVAAAFTAAEVLNAGSKLNLEYVLSAQNV